MNVADTFLPLLTQIGHCAQYFDITALLLNQIECVQKIKSQNRKTRRIKIDGDFNSTIIPPINYLSLLVVVMLQGGIKNINL